MAVLDGSDDTNPPSCATAGEGSLVFPGFSTSGSFLVISKVPLLVPWFLNKVV